MESLLESKIEPLLAVIRDWQVDRTGWRSLSSIIGRCTLYTPGRRMKAYK